MRLTPPELLIAEKVTITLVNFWFYQTQYALSMTRRLIK